MSFPFVQTLVGTIVSALISIFGVYAATQEKIVDLNHRVAALEKVTAKHDSDNAAMRSHLEKELKEMKDIMFNIQLQLNTYNTLSKIKNQ